MSQSNQTETPWSQYWREGALHGCTTGFPEKARDFMDQAWAGVFGTFDDGASILDVATGNGALLAHAGRSARDSGNTFSLTGIDLADIRAKDLLASQQISADIKSGIDASDLPFDDNSFDLVVSQFGLEYADFEVALKEAFRVGRRVVLLVHALEGVVVRQNADMVDQAHYVMNDLGLFAALEKYLTAPTPQNLQPLRQIADQMRAKAASLENPSMIEELMRDAGQLMNYVGKYQAVELARLNKDMESRLNGHVDRMAELAASGQTQEAINTALVQLGLNAEVSAAIVPETGFLVGYWIKGESAYD